MSVSYTIDAMQQLVHTQVRGVLDGEQLHAHQDKLRSDLHFHPDMRELMDCLEVEDVKLRTIINSRLVKCSPWGLNARRAIVVSSPLGFGLLSIFQSWMSGEHGEILVFRDMESAQEWLDS